MYLCKHTQALRSDQEPFLWDNMGAMARFLLECRKPQLGLQTAP